jgi:hypothetical protein
MNDSDSLPAVFEDIGQQRHENGHRREIAFLLGGDHRLVAGHSLPEVDLENHSLGFHNLDFHGPGFRTPGCRGLGYHIPGIVRSPGTVHNPETAHSLEKDLGCRIPDIRSSGCHGLEIVHNLDYRTGFALETDCSRNLGHGAADSVRGEIVTENHAYHHRLSCSKHFRRARRPS